MHWLERHWYRLSALHLLLWPLSIFFGVIAAGRRLLYRSRILQSIRLPVPVMVVGNINVGGTGKTPLTIWLAAWLIGQGWKPGIVCRGYGGSTHAPQRVLANDDPRQVGDEALLLARRCACPVWIGADRAAAARALLSASPDCDLIVSDDGLQHYALARDVELAVIDGERGFGNGMLLPAGPLREPPRRLARVDALIINGAARFRREILPSSVPAFEMCLQGNTFYNILDPRQITGPEKFAGRRVHAVAGIGNPQRFFDRLHEFGMTCVVHVFPDHHAYAPADLEFGDSDAVIMTEKDAVKCERYATENFWALRVDAETDPALGELVRLKIGT